MHDLYVVTCTNSHTCSSFTFLCRMHRFCSSLNCGVIFSGWLDTCLNPSFELGKEVHIQLDWHMQKSCITFTCKFLWMSSVVGSCVLESSVVRCWSIPWLDRPSIDTWSTSQYYWYSAETWMALNQHLNRQSIDGQLIVGQVLTNSYASIDTDGMSTWIIWLSTNCWPGCRSCVDQVSSEVSMEHRLRVDWGSIKDQSRLSIQSIDQHLTTDAVSTHDPCCLVVDLHTGGTHFVFAHGEGGEM